MAKGFGPLILNPKQERETKVLRKSVLKHFQHLEDPRADRGRNHSLVSIIAIAILAVLAGADGFKSIEAYGMAKQSWLETFLELPYGIPSHDTFGRVLGILEPEQLKSGFLAWIGEITEKLNIELIHIDGKTAKGSYDREEKLKALHTVSAYCSEHCLVLAQEKVNSKSNEITAVPLLLKLLNLKGAIVTLDAMGTQTEIAKQIIEGGGDYILALKGNQAHLSQQVKGWFEQIVAQNWSTSIEYSYCEKVESGHHRIETRQIWTVPVSQLPPLHRQNLWSGLTTVVMIRSTRQLWNKTTTEDRFFISSLSDNAEKHAQVIRSHWSIENSLHWVLDVTFNVDEVARRVDASQIRLGYGAENFGLLRRLSLNLLKREPSKMSLNMKRYTAGLNNDFMVKILAASSVD